MSQPPADKVDPKLKAAEDHLREVMLALPEVTEEFPWGHRTAKVKGKMFVILALDNDGLGVTTKLPESNEAALTLPFTEPTGYGLGKSGWVSARFKPGSEVPVGLLAQWIHESFRAVAPQKVLKAMLAASGLAPVRAAKPAARAKKPVAAKSAASAKSSSAGKPGAGGRAGVAAGGKKPTAGTAAAGGKKSVAKRAPAREGPTVRAGAKAPSSKRGAARSSRSKR
ncbi:MmcQ/YjbR family DNA-binding protein [Corallococcus macrosporus]|uniref:DifB protein n=1 Tax=Myxococcus fulvus (strain ATCC BAA-855 / HW-1) TaxID=483219 RepID=F8C904_MYXFH|nr:MmcQ/YjbR family DNA-binding protein [Corallococcus macrosporus]AEI64504.1 DifB protein [Corallococcus macrosporus]